MSKDDKAGPGSHDVTMVSLIEWHCACGEIFEGDVVELWTQHLESIDWEI